MTMLILGVSKVGDRSLCMVRSGRFSWVESGLCKSGFYSAI
jgi:hypothetical protein